jgi:hypothetical protein
MRVYVVKNDLERLSRSNCYFGKNWNEAKMLKWKLNGTRIFLKIREAQSYNLKIQKSRLKVKVQLYTPSER